MECKFCGVLKLQYNLDTEHKIFRYEYLARLEHRTIRRDNGNFGSSMFGPCELNYCPECGKNLKEE